MTTMALAYDPMYPRQGEWTIEDLYALPEDGIRRELVDGVLTEMPSPGHIHQKIAMRLGTALDNICPPEFDVTQAVDVSFDMKNSRCPDLLIVLASAAATGPSRFMARDVVLAAEIVSPSTKSQDRFAKPIQYAQAGIPHYWRIDLEPAVVVNTFTLDDSVGYLLDHEFSALIDVDKPWPIRLPFSDFVPKQY